MILNLFKIYSQVSLNVFLSRQQSYILFPLKYFSRKNSKQLQKQCGFLDLAFLH